MASQSTFLPKDFQIKPRTSAETDRRYLLSDSVAPSEAASMIYDAGDRTPRAGSPQRTAERRGTIADPTPKPYRGFPSEAHYLAALRAWAESKRYADHDKSLIGFYGQKSMQEYAEEPKLELGIRRKLRERKEKKEARRNTVV